MGIVYLTGRDNFSDKKLALMPTTIYQNHYLAFPWGGGGGGVGGGVGLGGGVGVGGIGEGVCGCVWVCGCGVWVWGGGRGWGWRVGKGVVGGGGWWWWNMCYWCYIDMLMDRAIIQWQKHPIVAVLMHCPVCLSTRLSSNDTKRAKISSQALY